MLRATMPIDSCLLSSLLGLGVVQKPDGKLWNFWDITVIILNANDTMLKADEKSIPKIFIKKVTEM